MTFAFLSGLTIWVGFLAFSQHGLAEQSALTSADRELTIQGSLLCYGACLPDPKPDDHLMALYAIDGTPDIRAPGARLADDFYPDKGLDAASAAKLMVEFTVRLKCYLSPQSPGLPKPKSTPNSQYCQPAASCAVTGQVLVKNGRKQIGEPTRPRSHAQAPEILSLYASLGYPVIPLCAKKSVAELAEKLRGHLTLLAGQSGMGKSTLINALFPQADARVDEFSEALDSGRHTTTHSRLYRLDDNSAVIDSPGFQEFSLAQLSREDIEAGMPDFRPFRGHCRFRDCRHHTEPGCAIRLAAEEGLISQRRLDFFRHIRAENER